MTSYHPDCSSSRYALLVTTQLRDIWSGCHLNYLFEFQIQYIAAVRFEKNEITM